MSLPKTYRKIVVADKTKGLFKDQCKVVEVAFVPPSAGEIAVRVLHAGVQASDIIQNSGGYGPLAGKEPPTDFDGTVQVGDCGSEGSGVVVAVGPEVTSFAVGDSVLWASFGTAFREYANIPVAVCSAIPAATPEAVALPVSALTAVGGLEISGRLQPGETVLVTAASGGTGQFAVQWAKMKGCFVVGTCSSAEKATLLKDLGCDATINYKTDDVDARLKELFPKGIDVVYESVGGSLRDSAWANMAVFGRLIVIGSVGDDYSDPSAGLRAHTIVSSSGLMKSASLTSFFLGHLRLVPDKLKEYLAGIFSALASGEMRVVMDPFCASLKGLNGVFDAQARMRTGNNSGKVYVSL